jgi:outer membrane murein-binding lipoprotein Lpp
MNKVLMISAIIVLILVAGCVSPQKNAVAPTPATTLGEKQSSTPTAPVTQTSTQTTPISAPSTQQFNGLDSSLNTTSQQQDTVPSSESNIPP